MRPKFADLTSEANPLPLPHQWKPLYERVQLKNKESIVVAVTGSGIDLILNLTEITPEPYGILYVLVVPCGSQSGRYQLKEWLDRSSLISYLERYRAFLEGDGRHNLWVKCGDDSLIVYDSHEVIYLYGDLDRFCTVLESLGYSQGEVRIDFPHEHHYNSEFDSEERSIADSADYTRFDLVAGQDFDANDPRR